MTHADLLTLYAHGPVLGYLSFLTVLTWRSGRVPAMVHLAAVIVGWPVTGLVGGWAQSLVALLGGLGCLLVLVAVASRTASGVSVFAMVATLILAPVQSWPGLVCGLLLAGGVALWKVWRLVGRDRVTWLTLDTLGAMGLSPAGGLQMPDPTRVPKREELTDVTASPEMRGLGMSLPSYLLAGMVAASGVAVLT